MADSAAKDGRERPAGSALEDLQHYEITYPLWIHPGRHKRSLFRDERPSEAEVLVTAEGRELRIHLRRNEQLLAPDTRKYGTVPVVPA